VIPLKWVQYIMAITLHHLFHNQIHLD
jgi:hypothetical protein